MAKRLICAVCGKTIVVSECIDLTGSEAKEVLMVVPCSCNYQLAHTNHGSAETNYPLKYY